MRMRLQAGEFGFFLRRVRKDVTGDECMCIEDEKMGNKPLDIAIQVLDLNLTVLSLVCTPYCLSRSRAAPRPCSNGDGQFRVFDVRMMAECKPGRSAE
jgi:hypothetical protein